MFEAVLLPAARAARDALSSELREQVQQALDLLELNPWSDGISKFSIRLNDIGFGLYDDGRWEVVYRVVDDRFIEIVGFSRLSS